MRHLALVASLLAGCGSKPGNGVNDPDAAVDGAADNDADASQSDAGTDATIDAPPPQFGPDQVWFAGDSMAMLHYDGVMVSPTTSAQSTYYSIWGSSPTNVLALAWNGEVVRFDGTQWGTSRQATGTLLIYSSIFGFAANDVWALGDRGTILRFDGTTWSSTNYGGTLTNWAETLWGTASNNMWALGTSPKHHHWNGTQWSDVPFIPGIYPFAIWGSSASDVWAVGQTLNQGGMPETSTIIHYDGSQWTRATVPAELNVPGQVLRSVWGSSASDVWAVGDDGLMAHWNGATWSKVASGTTHDLNAVGGSWSGSVWAAGAQGTILHRDNSGTWSPIASGTNRSIYALWVAPGVVLE